MKARLLLLVGLVLVAAAVSPVSALALGDPTYFASKTVAQRGAIEGIIGQITRDYTPGPATGEGPATTAFRERLARSGANHIRGIPSTFPGAQAVHSGTVKVAPRAGFWPRIFETAAGISRNKGAGLVMRASPLATGAFVLWQLCSATVCKKVPVRVSTAPVAAASESFRWTGSTGVCQNNQSQQGYAADSAAAGSCGAMSGSGTWTGSWSGPQIHIPANTLQLVMVHDGVTRFATECVGRTDGSIGGAGDGTKDKLAFFDPAQICTAYVPTGGADAMPTLFGPASSDRPFARTPLDPAECAGFSPCDRVDYKTGLRAWYQTPALGGAFTAPHAEDPVDWQGIGDSSRVAATMPSVPSSTSAQSAIGEFLGEDTSEAEAYRKELDHIFAEAPPESDASYSDPAAGDPAISNQGPASGQFSMPSCSGISEAACRSALTQAGHTGTVTVTTLTTATADLTKPAGAVVTTSPGANVTASSGATVTLTLNPDPLPLAIPAPNPGETATAYVARLQQLGLVGQVTTLSDLATDPGFGPSEVVRTNPQPGTRVQNGTQVDVTANPTTAPPATGGLSSSCGLTPPTTALNLSPITSLSLGTVFPFSMITVVSNALGDINVASGRPNFTVTAFGNSVGDLSYLANFDGVFSAIRLALSFGLAIGAAMFLWRRTLGA